MRVMKFYGLEKVAKARWQKEPGGGVSPENIVTEGGDDLFRDPRWATPEAVSIRKQRKQYYEHQPSTNPMDVADAHQHLEQGGRLRGLQTDQLNRNFRGLSGLP